MNVVVKEFTRSMESPVFATVNHVVDRCYKEYLYAQISLPLKLFVANEVITTFYMQGILLFVNFNV